MIDLQIQKAIILLRKNGYQVLPPKEDSSQVINEYHDKIEDLSFEHVWNLYQKKRGDKAKPKKKWEKLSVADRQAALRHIPLYVASTPDKQYRKDFGTYINNSSWNDEIIPYNYGQKNNSKQEAMQHIADDIRNTTQFATMDAQIPKPF